MSRAEFEKREHWFNGHLYAINEYGECTKDGVVTKGVEVHPGTDNRLLMRDYSAVVGYLHKDFGYTFEPLRVAEEVIAHKEVKLPDGDIDKITRAVYRTKSRGMYCEDVHTIFKPDGVTISDKKSYREAAPFEKF